MAKAQSFGRRTLLLAVAVGVAVLPVLTRGGQMSRPNIVFIIADDMGWADIGYHDPEVLTPHLDQLAEEGIRLERHYVMPTCTPTRVGLMTGRYPSRLGVLSPAYGDVFGGSSVTLAQSLRASGYKTFISGKWHMGSPPACTPLKYGFDVSYGYFHGQIDPYTHLYKTGVRSWHRNDRYLEEEGHATDLITDEAVKVVMSPRDRPFFLYVAYSVPHFPLDEPEQWTSLYSDKTKNRSRCLTLASISHMDAGIGRIVAAVDRKGIRDKTLIVFVSDNGGQESWYSETQYKGRYADKPHDVLGNNLPLRGWKGQVYEGGIRVPALVSWPKVLEPGTMQVPTHIVDWMPTLCTLGGGRPQPELKWDGKDIWPLIRSRARRGRLRTLYWKTPNAQALRHGDWKLLVDKQQQVMGLYNVTTDPYEENNMVQRYPERVEELKRRLLQVSAEDRERS